MHHYIMLGAPGSGKGTQAALIAKRLKIIHVSSGDLLRKNPPPEIAKKMAAGLMLEDQDVLGLIKDRLSKEDASHGWILDGFPRTISQANKLDTLFPNADIQAIYLNISDETIKHRLTARRTCAGCGQIYNLINQQPEKEGICDVCGDLLKLRDDDTEEVITKRLSVYHEVTAPLITFYKQKGRLITIDCYEGQSPHVVDSLIANQIDS